LSARIVLSTAALRSSLTGFVNTIAVPIPGAHSSCSRSRTRDSEPTSRVASMSSLLTALIAASASRPAARIADVCRPVRFYRRHECASDGTRQAPVTPPEEKFPATLILFASLHLDRDKPAAAPAAQGRFAIREK